MQNQPQPRLKQKIGLIPESVCGNPWQADMLVSVVPAHCGDTDNGSQQCICIFFMQQMATLGLACVVFRVCVTCRW